MQRQRSRLPHITAQCKPATRPCTHPKVDNCGAKWPCSEESGGSVFHPIASNGQENNTHCVYDHPPPTTFAQLASEGAPNCTYIEINGRPGGEPQRQPWYVCARARARAHARMHVRTQTSGGVRSQRSCRQQPSMPRPTSSVQRSSMLAATAERGCAAVLSSSACRTPAPAIRPRKFVPAS